jgi:hypothetical protein
MYTDAWLSEGFVELFHLPTLKSKTKMSVRLVNGQRVTSSTFFEIIFELARHEFKRTFYVLRDLRDNDMVLGLPWLDDEQALFEFSTTCVFTLMMEGTIVEIHTVDRRRGCSKDHTQDAPNHGTKH